MPRRRAWCPIAVTELSETYVGHVWTGTLANGKPAFGSTFCNDWNDGPALQSGGSGISSFFDQRWSFFDHDDCGAEAALYCFEN